MLPLKEGVQGDVCISHPANALLNQGTEKKQGPVMILCVSAPKEKTE